MLKNILFLKLIAQCIIDIRAFRYRKTIQITKIRTVSNFLKNLINILKSNMILLLMLKNRNIKEILIMNLKWKNLNQNSKSMHKVMKK